MKQIKNTIIVILVLMCFTGYVPNTKIYQNKIDNIEYHSDNELQDTSLFSITKEDITTYYDTLEEALLAAEDDVITTIKLLKDTTISSKVTIPTGKKVVLDGNNFTISRGKTNEEWYTGNVFTINQNAELTILNVNYTDGNNWTINEEAYEAAVVAGEKVTNADAFVAPETNGAIVKDYIFNNKGTLTVENSTFKNHYSTNKGLFYTNTSNSLLTIKNTTITHFASKGSGVISNSDAKDAQIIIEEGTVIEDNYAGGNGGIFRVYSKSSVTMNGGKINNNKSLNTNGTIAMMYLGIFTLNNGTISNNSGVRGANNNRIGAFYLHNGGQFHMNGGVIEGNRGNNYGGIDVAGYANSIIKLNSGIIRNNKVNGNDKTSDVSIGNDFDTVIGEGMTIEGNIYIYGDLTNNGVINGDVTLDITSSGDTTTITGNGQINGDIVIYYDKEEPPTFPEDTVNGNLVLCEKAEQVLLKFYYNGGVDDKGLTDHGLISVNAGEAAEPPKVIKEGYSVEWYMDEELTEPWDNVALPNKSHLFAKWIPNIYTITWKYNGKEVVQELAYGEEITLPTDTEREGYIFIGWTNYITGMTVPASNIVFTAEYTIDNPTTFDPMVYITLSALILLYIEWIIIIILNKYDKVYVPKKITS